MHNVLGIVVTEHARRMAVQGPLDLESKLLESSSVAAPRTLNKLIARSPGFRPHQRTFACPRNLL